MTISRTFGLSLNVIIRLKVIFYSNYNNLKVLLGRIFHNDFVQIHTSLRQLQALLHCPSFERPSNFVEQLEKHLMETEHFILSMKKRSKEEREKIIEAVRTLDVEVDSYYAKIQTWPELDRQLAQHQKTKSRVSHQWKQQDSYVLPEVLAYQDFITRYGPTGGWEEAQHITFVSVWNKLHVSSFEKNCHVYLIK